MIYSLRGTLIFYDNISIVIECGGIGYRCIASSKTISSMPEIGAEVFVYTYMAVREDSVDLYGFHNIEEMECFKLITAVSGVGSKTGISILSEFTPESLYQAVINSDAKAITRAGGVGLKTAQRILLELKDKVSNFDSDDRLFTDKGVEQSENSSISDAVAALMSFGYGRSEAQKAVRGVDMTQSVDKIIKDALKQLSRI